MAQNHKMTEVTEVPNEFQRFPPRCLTELEPSRPRSDHLTCYLGEFSNTSVASADFACQRFRLSNGGEGSLKMYAGRIRDVVLGQREEVRHVWSILKPSNRRRV